MKSVVSFIATNGWNMETNDWLFEDGTSKMIDGLPWKRLRGHSFPAVTANGVLYVLTNPGWHHDEAGVAYNPLKNSFKSSIKGFKPVGGHWYVWFQPEFQSEKFTQKYE